MKSGGNNFNFPENKLTKLANLAEYLNVWYAVCGWLGDGAGGWAFCPPPWLRHCLNFWLNSSSVGSRFVISTYVECGDGDWPAEVRLWPQYQSSVLSLQVWTEDTEQFGVQPEHTVSRHIYVQSRQQYCHAGLQLSTYIIQYNLLSIYKDKNNSASLFCSVYCAHFVVG